MVEVVVAVAIVSITKIDKLALNLFPQHIAIYPLCPMPHGFDLNLDPVPSLELWHHHRLGLPLFNSHLRFANGIIFLTGN